MTAIELLIHQTNRGVDSLFDVARKVPQDKLDWKPAEGARSALDQLQEVATALEQFANTFKSNKVEFSDEMFANWKVIRSKFTTLEALETECRRQTANYVEFLKTIDESTLTQPVEMPWPVERNVADMLGYHYWNCSYHEGQIYYILAQLGIE